MRMGGLFRLFTSGMSFRGKAVFYTSYIILFITEMIFFVQAGGTGNQQGDWFVILICSVLTMVILGPICKAIWPKSKDAEPPKGRDKRWDI